MNFDLTDDQRAIRQSAREFLSARYPLEQVRHLALEEPRGFTDAGWTEIAELGWPGLAIPEDGGGQGLGTVELAVLGEELGYAVAPSPLLATTHAGLLLAGAGASGLLTRVAEGRALATVASWDDPAAPVEMGGDGLTGRKRLVPHADAADAMVVLGSGGEVWVVEGAAGITTGAVEGIDPTRRWFDVGLTGAPAEVVKLSPAARGRAADQLAVAVAADSVGLAQRAMEMAVAYAKDRTQFDRPIGAYQAVSHRCAQMLLEVEGARSAVLGAAWALDHDAAAAPLAASVAKAYASDCGYRVCASALQVHGGIGFTWEHDLQFLLKRAVANQQLGGDARWHRARVADLARI